MRTQCKVLYVNNCLNPSFSPCGEVCCSTIGFFFKLLMHLDVAYLKYYPFFSPIFTYFHYVFIFIHSHASERPLEHGIPFVGERGVKGGTIRGWRVGVCQQRDGGNMGLHFAGGTLCQEFRRYSQPATRSLGDIIWGVGPYQCVRWGPPSVKQCQELYHPRVTNTSAAISVTVRMRIVRV